MAQQQLAQGDAALDAFDRLRFREVTARFNDTAFTFLAEFQSAVASMETDEQIKLEVVHTHKGLELLKAVLADPQASKICSLYWWYSEKEDVDSVIPLLVNNCPELALLWVKFAHHSTFDLVSSVLERPGTKVTVLEVLTNTEGDHARFFAALEQSQVLALSVFSDGTLDFVRGLCEYLAKDLLVRLNVDMGYKQVPSELMMSLAKCTCLAEFEIWQCEFSEPTAFAHLPKSITKLALYDCTFVCDVDWSFLVDSNVQELAFYGVEGEDGHQLGGALAMHLRAKGLDELCLFDCDSVDETLVAVGVELGRIKKLTTRGNLNEASIQLISLVLQSPNNELRGLRVEYYQNTISTIENYLVPALKHPNCDLAKLSLWAQPMDQAAAETVEKTLRHRRALFALLQGQQERAQSQVHRVAARSGATTKTQKQMAQQQLAQGDAALEAFDRLKVHELDAWRGDTVVSFLAEFQTVAASLEPEERIKLVICHPSKSSIELLEAVLADPQASKICALHWEYEGEEDVNPILPLLVNYCPDLVSLQVDFMHHCALGFVSSVLEHPSNRIKALHMPHAERNTPRFFAALEQSQVSALTICGDGSPEFARGWCDYLAKDLLVRLKVWRVPSEVMMSLATCTRLTKLEARCEFLQPIVFANLPKSIAKLVLSDCSFVRGFDWSFLIDSNVRELDFYEVRGVNGSQFGGALAVHLRAKGLDKLRLFVCDFVDATLAAIGVEIGRIERLSFGGSSLNDASVELIADTLQSPNSEMKELRLDYDWRTASSIENLVVPALRRPNCRLTKFSLRAGPEHPVANRRVESTFSNRIALFALLQGRQVGKRYCPLRRLPVEMFRMVGEVLL